ncbi:MAG: hypothetical protein IT165_36295 [Bryobacterales bacterium]|nr:hypothetical protein [Bryobacterales bacterium]
MSSLRTQREPAPTFDAVEYVLYLRRRYRFVVLTCAIAAAAALLGSLFLPKRYTSMASILIEPPAGSDPRTFTAISPIYLESLKTYEVFATSDSLFLRALDRFHLRDRATPLETLKARVLKVSKLRDTKVLQISVTLPDPKQAQAMAQFLAEETVKLSSTVTRETGRDLMEDVQRQVEAARAKLEQLQAEWSRAMTDQPVEALRTEVDSMVELQYRLRRNLSEAEASAAENESKAKPSGHAESSFEKDNREFAQREGAAMRARAALLSGQIADLDRAVAARSKLLAERSALLQKLEANRKDAQSDYDAAVRRGQDIRSSVGNSGERLKIIDPGIVPERPSEPRILLNVVIAFGLALTGAIVFLSLGFSLRP